jgi:hypothetical protein
MKKLVALAVVVGSIASAQAATWVNEGTAGNGTTFYLDTGSLVFSTSARDSASVWIKAVNRNGTYDLDRFEAHCPSRMSRFLANYSFSANSTQLKAWTTPTDWSFPVPGSFMEGFVDYICGPRR